jgi:hypothetical protein
VRPALDHSLANSTKLPSVWLDIRGAQHEAQALFSAWVSNLDPDAGLLRFSQSNPPIRILVIRVCAT